MCETLRGLFYVTKNLTDEERMSLMKQFTFDGITITGDGMTVTARHYVNGELTCSAEAQANPWDECNFLSVATDALYKLKDKEQGSSTVEYCKTYADNTAEYYKYRQEHPELFPDDAPKRVCYP